MRYPSQRTPREQRPADLRLAGWAGEDCRNRRDELDTVLIGLVADRPRGCDKGRLRQASYENRG
jgi:hypothetical protein